jgi:hypothetical protein
MASGSRDQRLRHDMFITHKPLVEFEIPKLPQLIGIFFCNQTFSASSGQAFSQVKSIEKTLWTL